MVILVLLLDFLFEDFSRRFVLCWSTLLYRCASFSSGYRPSTALRLEQRGKRFQLNLYSSCVLVYGPVDLSDNDKNQPESRKSVLRGGRLTSKELLMLMYFASVLIRSVCASIPLALQSDWRFLCTRAPGCAAAGLSRATGLAVGLMVNYGVGQQFDFNADVFFYVVLPPIIFHQVGNKGWDLGFALLHDE